MEEQSGINDLNLIAINDEYDLQISNLREQLLLAKEERKKTESEYNSIKNRLIKLKNQEVTNNLNFQNIKYRFKLILQNRLESQKKLKSKNIIPLKKSSYSSNKKSNISSNNNSTKKYKNKKNKNGQENKKRINNDKNNDINKQFKNNNDMNNNEKDLNEEEQEKILMKELLLEKLKKDQEEKKRIEEEIAKIEEEELLLINEFNKGKGENKKID